jgi:hypothetical protein
MGSAIDKMLGRQTGSTGGSGWASRAGR